MVRAAFNRTLRSLFVRSRGALVGHVERRNGIETGSEIQLARLGLEGLDRMGYKPAGWFTLRRILPPSEVSRGDVFLDIGSGMGRLVFQAARDYPFRRVIGVELSEELSTVARGNIDRNRHRLQCEDVELVVADVLDYRVPDDVTVVFLYNPFVGDLFAASIEKLLASLDRNPRRMRVIYGNPREHDWLMLTGRFREVRRVRGLRPNAEWSRSNSTRLYELQ